MVMMTTTKTITTMIAFAVTLPHGETILFLTENSLRYLSQLFVVCHRIRRKLFQPSHKYRSVNTTQGIRGKRKERQNCHQSGQAMTNTIRSHPSTGGRRTGWYTGSHEVHVLNTVEMVSLLVVHGSYKTKGWLQVHRFLYLFQTAKR